MKIIVVLLLNLTGGGYQVKIVWVPYPYKSLTGGGKYLTTLGSIGGATIAPPIEKKTKSPAENNFVR